MRNNIKFGNPNATDEEMIDISKKAQCHDFIIKLPQGYDTVLQEGGSNLSGGERQRLSIARAMLKRSRFVILDEATSSVDQIVVLKNGAIEQVGTHTELASKQGIYKEFLETRKRSDEWAI